MNYYDSGNVRNLSNFERAKQIFQDSTGVDLFTSEIPVESTDQLSCNVTSRETLMFFNGQLINTFLNRILLAFLIKTKIVELYNDYLTIKTNSYFDNIFAKSLIKV